MKLITLNEKKKILLGMLVEIDKFCKKNHINYFLTGGTLIGAIRHGGFIPWDDDIDIALLRNDYEKLVSIFQSESGNIELRDFRNSSNYMWPYAKFIHNKTVLIENGNKSASIGVFIDVFPLDNVPGTFDEVKRYLKKVLFWKNLLSIKHLHVRVGRSLFKNTIVILGKVLFLVPDKFLIRKIHELSIKYQYADDCTYVCSFTGSYGEREITKKHLFTSYLNCLFEGHEFIIPAGYDEFLTKLYGDYMTPPPKEKRVSTHVSVEYWK